MYKMTSDFDEYSCLNYQNQPNQNSDGFIEFLLQNTNMNTPEPDEDKAWLRFHDKLNTPQKPSNSWLKIAASITVVFAVSILLYLNISTIEQLSVVSTAQKINVTFPDGSLGVLNAHSSFSFPEKFGDERRVSFQGEAYFDIRKSEKPFIIDMNDVEVEVLGTAFNLVLNENNVALYVDRGMVAFSSNGIKTKVKAGLEAIFERKNNEVTIKKKPSANIMSWRNGHFKFDKTPLKDALLDLGEYYKIDFKLANGRLNACRVSATFQDKPFNEVMELIEAILNVKVDLRNKTVNISGQGC